MNCRVCDLRYKNVINIVDGAMLGCVNDIEIDTCSARITSIIIYGKYRFLGLLGKEEDIIIPWRDIKVIGEDVVLVKYEHFEVKKKRIFTLWKDLFK